METENGGPRAEAAAPATPRLRVLPDYLTAYFRYLGWLDDEPCTCPCCCGLELGPDYYALIGMNLTMQQRGAA